MLSAEEIARGLEALGVPPEKAHAEARRQVADAAIVRGTPAPAVLELEPSTPVARRGIDWPLRVLIPWSALVSDNDKTRARLITRKGQPAAINVITREYAAAREKIAGLARGKVGDAKAVDYPLRLRALVWVPDERPHDVTNYCKLVHDALEDVVYQNDRWLHDVHWTRAGVDVDAPRAEVTITPLLCAANTP